MPEHRSYRRLKNLSFIVDPVVKTTILSVVTQFEIWTTGRIRTTYASRSYVCEMTPMPESNFKMSHYPLVSSLDQTPALPYTRAASVGVSP